ncbi:MAG TPA: polysaccharide biosynthesis tyrosine autokinase [Novosphingobium sp.]|nr:polysaccharide biosynthesis tyrosine autokinase [Novosphingobium sp.]
MTAQVLTGLPVGTAPPLTAHRPVVGFELGDVLRIVSERRWIILGSGAIGLLLGIISALMMTPLYRASATLELNPQTNEMIEGAAGGKQGAVRGANQEMLGTQIGLLKSETLARRVAQNLNLVSAPAYGGAEGTRDARTERAVAIIQANTTVEPAKNSLLIRVDHIATDPVDAAKVANALAQGFIASSLERRYDSSSYARKFLSDQLARTKVALEDSERTVNSYAIDAGLFRTPGTVVDGKTSEGSTLAANDLIALNEALNVARVKRINSEQAYRNSAVDFAADQASNVSTLVDQRTQLQAEYDQLSRTFKPDYPQMRELQAKISRIDSSISGERGRVVNNKRGELMGDFMAAQRTEAQIAAQVAAAKGEVQSERSRSIQYNILQREVDTNRALYDALLQRYKEIGVAGGIGQSTVSIVDQAEAPRGPFKPRLPINAGVGMLLGLALGVASAFAIHLLFDNIIDPGDVRNKLHLPVLGVIPLESEGRTLMEALADRKSDVSEAYYSVRTALKFSRPGGAPKTLLITSTRPGEGKSTSAYAIASSMARLGGKVLLVDADLRRPTFMSSRKDGYGLAHLLGTEEPLAAYVEKTQIDNLSLIPVGRFVGSAAELLSSNRLPIIINEASQTYDMVVIDGPPVLGLTDAPLLSAAAESTAIVIESRASRTANVIEMNRRLTEAGGSVIGVILTKVSLGGNGYGYNYYSYTYGSDGSGGRVSSDPSRALDLGGSAE